MTRRIALMQESLQRIDDLLESLQLTLELRKPDRDPLTAYLDLVAADNAQQAIAGAARPPVSPSPRRRKVAAPLGRMARRNVARGKCLALPAALAASLMVLALVRLPSANTGWTEQLIVKSNVGTGDFNCDPVKLEFVEAVTVGSDTKFVYALSGGGGTGPNCQDADIASVSIPVCFGPALKPGGDVVSETHPGNVAASWKLATNSKAVTWDALTTTPPLGGKGPFDPARMRFSFTLAGTVALSPLPAHASFEAGTEAFDAGAVKVPACPLPSTALPAGPAASPDAGSPEAVPAATGTPTPTPKPSTPTGPVVGGRGSGTSSGAPSGSVKPTATPTPLGVMIWD